MPTEDEAASTVGAAIRGRASRKALLEKKQAATKVSAHIRGSNSRKKARKAAKAAADSADDAPTPAGGAGGAGGDAAAATAIQARYRGVQARQKKIGRGAQQYYTPAEVSMHDRADDLWLSLFHKVVDLTELVAANPGRLAQPLIDAAGTDVTHWFDGRTRDLRKYVDPATQLEAPFLPMGQFLHAPPAVPSSEWATDFGVPWWKDKRLVVGRLTVKTRKIKLFNMLTKQEATIDVCAEETLGEIEARYMAYNQHAKSYTWKRTDGTVGRVLDMGLTLEENGIPDETPTFDSLDIDEDYYVPVIHLYFSDDLTVA